MIAPSLEAMGYRLVRVAFTGGRRATLQVMAERRDEAPMTVEDCAEISRNVSALLDVADPVEGRYDLEVSSPGIDRPLTREKDFARWTGHVARVETAQPIDGRRRFKGTLLGLDAGAVRLRLDDGTEAQVPLSAVAKAKLELTDALLDEHRRAQEGAEQSH